MSYDLEQIKNDIKEFVRYDLYDYHHERYMSPSEGDRICNFLINIIENLSNYSDVKKNEIKLLQVEIKRDDLEHLGLIGGEWYKSEKYIDKEGELIYKVYGDKGYSVDVKEDIIEEIGEWYE